MLIANKVISFVAELVLSAWRACCLLVCLTSPLSTIAVAHFYGIGPAFLWFFIATPVAAIMAAIGDELLLGVYRGRWLVGDGHE